MEEVWKSIEVVEGLRLWNRIEVECGRRLWKD